MLYLCIYITYVYMYTYMYVYVYMYYVYIIRFWKEALLSFHMKIIIHFSYYNNTKTNLEL